LDALQILQIEGVTFTAEELAKRSLLKIRNMQAIAYTMHETIDHALEEAVKKQAEASSIVPAKKCKRCGLPIVPLRVGRGRRPEYHPPCRKEENREHSRRRQRAWQKKHPNLKRGQGYARRLIAKDATTSTRSNNALDIVRLEARMNEPT